VFAFEVCTRYRTGMSAAANRWDQLDHIRALAAFLVFTWHFTHGSEGTPSAFEGAPMLPLAAFFDEGHVGVALFMCLSGYLFAKLLDGKVISYPRFIAARLVRLLPLLGFVMVVGFVLHLREGGAATEYLVRMAKGLVRPSWPNGGWSITVELHFYAILPLLLALRRRYPMALPVFLVIAIALRTAIYARNESIQFFAYWTIIGRIDQFLLGIMFYDCRRWLKGQHLIAGSVLAAFALVYYLFDQAGGFYKLGGVYPSPSPLWIVLPTIEAICCSVMIAWYDTSFAFRNVVARFAARLGFYSYGIYLLHFYFYAGLSAFIDENLIPLDNFYVGWAVALPCFVLMMIPAWLAYVIIEKPCQRLRPGYVIRSERRERNDVSPPSLEPVRGSSQP
jgi:peptidoglycan/LPS O-acetylase OafA/YrhL